MTYPPRIMANAGNGNKVIILNTRERVLSTDANRAQTFYGQGVADLLRFMVDASCEESHLGGGYEVLSDGTETPTRAYVVNGLRPQPVNGTASLLVTPGVMLVVDNPADPNTDDSVASWITDPGISLTGILTLPANGTGLTIIGVVECQRTTLVLEQDNRDVFNANTGLFSPQLVNKVTAGRLIYRIRLGTPGSGFPGVAAGWAPLAVFNQPAAATTWDDVLLMWDVRTLVNDRWNAPFNTPLNFAELVKGFAYVDTQTPGQSLLISELDANRLEARAGGRPGADDPDPTALWYFDLEDVANRPANFAGYSANKWWTVFAIFPHGLPRWQRYSSAATTAPRRPCGMRGIPAVTNVGPSFGGAPATPINTPTATGLLDAAASNAVALISGQTDATPNVLPALMDGHVVWAGDGATENAATSSTLTQSAWTLLDNFTHPGNARALWVRLVALFTTGAIGTGPVTVAVDADCFLTSADNQGLYLSQGGARTAVRVEVGAGTSFLHGFTIRIPLGHSANFVASRLFTFKWKYSFVADVPANAPGLAVSAAFLAVLGWEPGP